MAFGPGRDGSLSSDGRSPRFRIDRIVDRIWIGIGSALGFLGVAAGAFGAHILKSRLSPDLLEIYEKGARYQMFHALALLAVGLFARQTSSSTINVAGWCFTLGTVVFSGTLYVLALTGIRVLGAITPLGGLAFLAGWIALGVAALRAR